MTRRPSPAAIDRAGAALALAIRLCDEPPVDEAARRAYTPTGPTLAELETRITARRTGVTGTKT